MSHSASVRNWRPREELALSLTPVFQDEIFCAGCPLRAFCEEDTTMQQLLDLYAEAWRATSYTSLLAIFEEIEELLVLIEREKYQAEIDSPEVACKTHETMRASAIDDETVQTWEQYEDTRMPIRAKGALLPLINAPKTLDERLADMTWLHALRDHRPDPKRTVRKGRRHKIADHGTAIERKQITANRRERLRKARQNRHTKHYTPDWKLRARREEQSTWSVTRVEMAEVAKMTISHGLFYLSVTDECTDSRCCPEVLDPWWDNDFFGDYDSLSYDW